MSWRSKALAVGSREDTLVKKDNGKTSNIDFWEAIPDNKGVNTLNTKSLMKKKNAAKKRELEAAFHERKMLLQSEEEKMKKAYDPIPMYTSPYCKELLATDIPLKTIISRSKKVNSKNMAKFKAAQASNRNKYRNGSKSKSLTRRSGNKSGYNSLRQSFKSQKLKTSSRNRNGTSNSTSKKPRSRKTTKSRR